jgi:hypothetical protein
LIARRSGRWEKRVELLSLQDQARDVFGWVVGVEPDLKRKFNNLQDSGWHKKHC